MSSDKLQECTPSRRLSTTMQASRGATNDVSSGMNELPACLVLSTLYNKCRNLRLCSK